MYVKIGCRFDVQHTLSCWGPQSVFSASPKCTEAEEDRFVLDHKLVHAHSSLTICKLCNLELPTGTEVELWPILLAGQDQQQLRDKHHYTLQPHLPGRGRKGGGAERFGTNDVTVLTTMHHVPYPMGAGPTRNPRPRGP